MCKLDVFSFSASLSLSISFSLSLLFCFLFSEPFLRDGDAVGWTLGRSGLDDRCVTRDEEEGKLEPSREREMGDVLFLKDGRGRPGVGSDSEFASKCDER